MVSVACSCSSLSRSQVYREAGRLLPKATVEAEVRVGGRECDHQGPGLAALLLPDRVLGLGELRRVVVLVLDDDAEGSSAWEPGVAWDDEEDVIIRSAVNSL